MPGMAKPPASIRILRVGTFTDIHGTKVSFGQQQLDELIASYDATRDPAPIVVGHPKIDAPAYGWIGSLAMQDGHLVAHPSKMSPAFAEAVEAGHYAKVSPQLYPPTSPSNPVPGKWYLQHVGFLGGAAPAIKGMGTVAFADTPGEVITITYEENPMTTAPEQAVDALAFAEREAELKKREDACAATEQALNARERDDRHAANVAFAEGLIDDVKLAPAAKDRVVGLLDLLDAAQPVAFGEGDANAMTPHAAFRSLLEGAAPVVALGEHAPADTDPPVEETPAALAERALAFAEEKKAAGVSITIAQAVRHVQAHPAT